MRSLAHLLGDLGGLALLVALSIRFDSTVLLPAWALAQGTLLWALFVIGHDCGHGSFSRHRWLNELVGHLCHTLVMVPYHAWRLSHARHHRHVGDADRDEGWYPLTASELEAAPLASRLLFVDVRLLSFPVYLLRGTPRRGGSHFDAGAETLFSPQSRGLVRRSVLICGLFTALLLVVAVFHGPAVLVRYGLAYAVFVIWIDLVTLLHHTDRGVPWYRGADWTPVAGAVGSIDRDYGLLEHVHHHAGHHVAHHLFPEIPHYRLRQATAVLAPLLGAHYQRSEVPIPIAFWRALRECRQIDNEGSPVFYRSGREPASRAPIPMVAPSQRSMGVGHRRTDHRWCLLHPRGPTIE